jgi:hypothetical protein
VERGPYGLPHPDAFLARLALDDFDERFVAIQMALEEGLADRGASVTLRPVVSNADWDALLWLVIANHAERRDVDGLDLPPEFSAATSMSIARRATRIISIWR